VIKTIYPFLKRNFYKLLSLNIAANDVHYSFLIPKYRWKHNYSFLENG